MTSDGFQDQLNTLISNSIELETESKEVWVPCKKFTEIINGLIIKLIVVEIDLLDHVALIHGMRQALESHICNQVVFDRELGDFSLASNGSGDLYST